MSFTSPYWLLLLLLVPLVILLHMLTIRWRSVPVSSLVFWDEVLKERTATVRIRRLLTSLLLLLQVLAVTALALALAGPVFPGLGGLGRTDVILVLDATASMQAREGSRTRFDMAREKALGLAAGLRGGARMAVVLAESSPRLLCAFTGDKAVLRRLVHGAAATAEPGDVAASMVFALSLRDARRGGEVVLETDGAFDDLPGVDTALPWIHVDLVGTARDNVGITRMAFRRLSASSGGASGGGAGYELFMAIRNTGRAAVSVPLTVTAGGKDVIKRTLSLDAGQRSVVTAPWTGPLDGRVEAALAANDAFPLDDRAFAVFQPARRLQVLVVGHRPWFIQQALAALPGVTMRMQEMPPKPGDPAAAAADLSVYVDVAPPLLEKGSFLLFGAVPPNLPLRVRGNLAVPAVTGWSRTSALLDSVSLAGMTIGEALDLDPGPGFSVLAASGTSPLLLTWDHAGVKALVAAFDPGESDFPLRPGFPILLANALSWFFPSWLGAQADDVQAGASRVIPSAGVDAVTVVKPSGDRVRLDADGESIVFSGTDETGFYRVESAREPGEFAVNLSSDSETDITPRFAPPPPEPGTAGGPRGEAASAWAVCAAAALALILLEWLVWLWVPARRRS